MDSYIFLRFIMIFFWHEGLLLRFFLCFFLQRGQFCWDASFAFYCLGMFCIIVFAFLASDAKVEASDGVS